MDFITQPQRRILSSTLLLLGSTAFGGIAGSVIPAVTGGIIANDIVPQHLNSISARLRGSREQLSNHDLTQAVGLAIGLIIQSIAEAGTYPDSSKDLKTLAKGSVKAWQQVAEDLKSLQRVKFDPLQETEVSELFSQGYEQQVLAVADWRELLQEWLCPQAGVWLKEYVLQEVATQLREKFALALREVIKADLENGGKAFAGLLLDLLQSILGTVQELANPSREGVKEELAAFQAFQEGLDRKNTAQWQQLGEQFNSGFTTVLQELEITQQQIAIIQSWLQEELQQVSQQLEKLQDTVEQGFQDVSDQHQALQETVKTGFEEIKGFFEQKPTVQAISYFLDVNPPTVKNWQGREADLATVHGWLDDEETKLGVIVGIAGMGKSTLAAKVYKERTDFVDKLWLDLGQRPSYSLVVRGILQKLGGLSSEALQEIEETRLTQVVIHCLVQQRFLLVLDNLESVLQDEGYQDFLRQWMGGCHQTEILVTTQDVPRFSQRKPQELPLGGLSLEAGQHLLQVLGVGGREEALQGFVERVNGHPLTLTLVAGLLRDEKGERARIEHLDELGLADVGQFLESLAGDHRRETVQLVAVLDASFHRLAERLQGVLLSLVVLRQGFDAGVASAMSGEEVQEKELRGLAKRGFLVEETEGVYTFQPFIGEYLQYKLGDLRGAHLKAIEFYESRFKSREEWETVEDVQEYLEVFYHRCELGEYVAAFDVIRDWSDNVNEFLNLRGNNQLLVELYQQLVKYLPDRQDWRYTASLTSLGYAYNSLGRYTEAIEVYQQSLTIEREIGYRRGEANSLNGLGHAYYFLGRCTEAIEYHQQSLTIEREIGRREGEANSLNNLGNAYDSLGRCTEAIEYLQQSLTIHREIGNRGGEASSLNGLGNAY
ncbi:tetratricopeptide repeat protein [Spirulina sp. CS-785/01]|uniref:tetratricopeptide repeat protein n=1 Tax=Spirulina sp. CS-785/01 TaxID=3021716 RepID=UPI00232DA326|nr:tetratricopeptide repeat protein [Spirulina sp. CS-785/01]MDB9312549.1 tetratricopeptide repeat protein [Spirulina sp. CS-785/01]